MEIRVTPETSVSELKTALLAAKAAGYGTTETSPLNIRCEPGEYLTMYNPLSFKTAPFRNVYAGGAIFLGTGDQQENAAYQGISHARQLRHFGGSVVGADVAPLGGTPEREEYLLEGMDLLNYMDGGMDGIAGNSLEGSSLKTAVRKGVPTRLKPHILTMRKVRIINWTGSGGVKHPVYLHDNYGEVHYEECLFSGGKDGSMTKTTRNLATYRSCHFWGEEKQTQGEFPDGEGSISKFIDVPSGSETIIHASEFHLAYHGEQGGVTEAVWFCPRATQKNLNSETFAPADVHFHQKRAAAEPFDPVSVVIGDMGINYDAQNVYAYVGATRLRTPCRSYYLTVDPRPTNKGRWIVTIQPDEAPESGSFKISLVREDGGIQRRYEKPTLTFLKDDQRLMVSSFIDATTEKMRRVIDPDFWNQVGDVTDPANPWTQKKWISECKYTRYHNPAYPIHQRGGARAIRDDGTYPMEALKQFANNRRLYPVAPNWKELSVVFAHRNEFSGWLPTEVGDLYWMRGFKFREGFDEIYGKGGQVIKEVPPPTLVLIPSDDPRPEWFKV